MQHVGQVQVQQDDVVVVELAEIDPLFLELGRVHFRKPRKRP
jgi:hypothetical protein